MKTLLAFIVGFAFSLLLQKDSEPCTHPEIIHRAELKALDFQDRAKLRMIMNMDLWTLGGLIKYKPSFKIDSDYVAICLPDSFTLHNANSGLCCMTMRRCFHLSNSSENEFLKKGTYCKNCWR